jgi:hypothetical protein
MSAPTLAAPNRARFASPDSLPRMGFTGKLTHPARRCHRSQFLMMIRLRSVFRLRFRVYFADNSALAKRYLGSMLMSSGSVEDRIKRLEQKVQQLEEHSAPVSRQQPWWDRIAGAFNGDPVYMEAMQMGAEIRKATASEAGNE